MTGELAPGRVGIAYAACLVVFLILDSTWIATVVIGMYRSQLGSLMLDKPSVPPAIMFYLLYVAGLVFFAVVPALRHGNWTTGLVNGAAYGFFAYLTYSLTNLSILRGWTGVIAVSDILWGVVVSAASACGAYFITRWMTG